MKNHNKRPHVRPNFTAGGADIPPHDRATLLALFGAVSRGEYCNGQRLVLQSRQSPDRKLVLVVCRGTTGKPALRFEPPELAA